MQVRGAPLIAIVAALGLAVDAWARRGDWGSDSGQCAAFLVERMQYLRTSRPTAVNLFKCTDELTALVQRTAAAAITDRRGQNEVLEAYLDAAEAMLAADVAANRAIGDWGADAVVQAAAAAARRSNKGEAPKEGPQKLTVMTICNTGSLATAGYGTALGVVRSLHARGLLAQCYACETRPYNQGSRLTAYELVADGLPGTLICDSMAAACMRAGKHGLKVDAVVVGADRVAANGDTANKIGTYQLSIVAKHHGAAFFVAAPSTSIDLGCPNGEAIPIEERPAQELRCTAGVQVAPEAIPVWNPAFDYAPAALITGIVTEHGVCYPTTTTKKKKKKEEEEEEEETAGEDAAAAATFDLPAYLAQFEGSGGGKAGAPESGTKRARAH